MPRHPTVAPPSWHCWHTLSCAMVTASSRPHNLLLLTCTPGAHTRHASCTQHSVPGGCSRPPGWWLAPGAAMGGPTSTLGSCRGAAVVVVVVVVVGMVEVGEDSPG